jgi:intracellular sulfur oxidation DsrE/DsrF family protein
MSRSLSILTITALFVLSTSGECFSQQQQLAVPRPAPARAIAAKPAAPNVHHVVIQVTQNDPALMSIALNNAENLSSYYQQKGERVQIEFVAYGPGLHMLRSDTSPVRDRIKSFAEKSQGVTFSGCGNTLNAQSKQENKQVTLLPEARIVPTGIARITELQEQGWTYVRP